MTTTQEQATLRPSADLLELLRCPGCRAALRQEGDGYVYLGCKPLFPQERGVIRCVDAANRADGFGFQGQRYARAQMDDAAKDQSEKDFRRKTGLTLEQLNGKPVLDPGCGVGRYAEVATRWGARVVGVDLSAAAEVAAENLAGREFVAFRGDVFALPFLQESFDYIYSIGVLHHTPDCERGCESAAPVF